MIVNKEQEKIRSWTYLQHVSFVLTERKVCEASGPATQFPQDRLVHVSQQLPRQLQREAARPQVHSGPAHLHHLLQDESESPLPGKPTF